MTDFYPLHTWVIDWNKINSVEDIKRILQGMELRPITTYPMFDTEIKPLCKLIDRDGNAVDPETLEKL